MPGSGGEAVSKRISQREARRLRQRVDQLERAIERQRASYAQEWFGGVNIASHQMPDSVAACIRTARQLKHAVVVIGDDSDSIRFMALPLPKVER